MAEPSTGRHPPAVVIGLCVHGLALARALNRRGVRVYALESNQNLPGVRTAAARVFDVVSINSPELIDSLVALRASFRSVGDLNPTIFPINDNAVRILAEHWSRLEGIYRLSWSGAISAVQHLLDKGNLEAFCASAGVTYPKSLEVVSADQFRSAMEAVSFPVIVKPTHPLSAFKANRLSSIAEAEEHIDAFPNEYPLLVQPWIPGDDKSIYFCALYLRDGAVLAQFVGQKLKSHPPAMGQTTAAIPVDAPEVAEYAAKFFRSSNMRGPVSLEVKRSPSGELFVIEPTVGRTDYWVDVCTHNGVNLPWIEYCDVAGLPIPSSSQSDRTIWLDSERDPLIFWNAWRSYGGLSYLAHRFRFAFLDLRDPWPFIAALGRFASKRIGRSLRRKGGVECLRNIPPIVVHRDFDEYRQDGCCEEKLPFFSSLDWFASLYRRTFLRRNKLCLLTLGEREARATLPLLEGRWRGGVRYSYIANYYSPHLGVIVNGKNTQGVANAKRLIDDLPRLLAGVDSVWLSPLSRSGDMYTMHLAAFRRAGWMVQPFFVAGNWYQRTDGGTFTDYLRGRSSRLQNTLKRKHKQFTQSGGFIQLCISKTCIDLSLQAFEHIYTHSWKTIEPYPEFIRDMAHKAASRGELRLGVAYLEQKPIAAQLWIVSHGVASIYKLAYDQNYKSYSPGTLLTAELMKYVMDVDRVEKVDFLNGDEPFKKDWMEERDELWGIVIYNPRRVRGRLYGLVNATTHWVADTFRRLIKSRHDANLC